MVARGMSPDAATSGARAYQYRDYVGGRQEDAVGDYQENVAGINAFDPEQGRLSDEARIDLALQFAQQRMSK